MALLCSSRLVIFLKNAIAGLLTSGEATVWPGNTSAATISGGSARRKIETAAAKVSRMMRERRGIFATTCRVAGLIQSCSGAHTWGGLEEAGRQQTGQHIAHYIQQAAEMMFLQILQCDPNHLEIQRI